MKLILRRSVEHLGDAGEVVNVKAGYGRNFLLPQGLAYEATPGNLKVLEAEQAKAAEVAKRDLNEAKRRASMLSGISLVFHARAAEGEDGKLFGSVTNADIAERLNSMDKVDFEVDRRLIHLEEPLKHLGVFHVQVRLHAEVQPEVEIRIEREEE
jgi:large subunit ribosomal protein L9